MNENSDRLFTPRFFVMCGFTFTVFLSAFQLFPTAPFRIIDLGGTKSTAGLFLGLLTYGSALSAPFTGGLSDRLGKKRTLVLTSSVLTLFSIAYGVSTNYSLPLILVVPHGIFWSGLLSASSAYMADIIPEGRRAEGIGYWGISSVIAIALAPSLGLWLYHFGWEWLCGCMAVMNLVMTLIAMKLQKDRPVPLLPVRGSWVRSLVEWRVLILSITLFLYSFGHGGITSFSALYAQAYGIEPHGIYFTTMAIAVLLVRPFSGTLADRLGTRRVFLPSLALIACGMGMLAWGETRGWLIASALVYGAGLGTTYPVFSAYILEHVSPQRRGAAFGSVLAAFDIGIGSGSIVVGNVIDLYGFHVAFGLATSLAMLSIPYFLLVEKRVRVSGSKDR